MKYTVKVAYAEWEHGSGWGDSGYLDQDFDTDVIPDELSAYDAIQWIYGDSGYDEDGALATAYPDYAENLDADGEYQGNDTLFSIEFFAEDSDKPIHVIKYWNTELYASL